MLVQQLMILGYIPVVEIGDPEIKEDIEEEGKVEDFEVETIIHHARDDLYVPVNSKNPDGFDQEVKRQQQPQVCQKFSLHSKKVKSSVNRNFSSILEK